MDIADELQKLQQLHDSGAISDEEFAQAKAKLLTTPPSGIDSLFGSTNTEQQTRQWAMLLHFSQFAGHLVPFGGFIVPILIWQTPEREAAGNRRARKDRVQLDHQSVLCTAFCASSLFFMFVGIPLR